MSKRHILLLVLTLAVNRPALASGGHRVVVDLFSGGPGAMKSALGNIENLRKALAGQPLKVEIVAYGPGIDLVIAKDNFFADQMKKMNAKGVEFATCANTMRTRHIAKADLLPFVRIVPAGVAEVVLKQEQGWAYLRR